MDIFSYIYELPGTIYSFMKQKDYISAYKEYSLYSKRSKDIPDITVLQQGKEAIERTIKDLYNLLLKELETKKDQKTTVKHKE